MSFFSINILHVSRPACMDNWATSKAAQDHLGSDLNIQIHESVHIAIRGWQPHHLHVFNQ